MKIFDYILDVLFMGLAAVPFGFGSMFTLLFIVDVAFSCTGFDCLWILGFSLGAAIGAKVGISIKRYIQGIHKAEFLDPLLEKQAYAASFWTVRICSLFLPGENVA